LLGAVDGRDCRAGVVPLTTALGLASIMAWQDRRGIRIAVPRSSRKIDPSLSCTRHEEDGSPFRCGAENVGPDWNPPISIPDRAFAASMTIVGVMRI
jgi:hypothetical protein